MRQSTAHPDNRSIKTFLIYSAIVIFFIFLSLSVRMFYLLQHSKYDGKHQIVIALGQDNIVQEIIVFRPTDQSALQLKLSGDPLQASSLGKRLGILPDATVSTTGQVSVESDIQDTMQAMALHYYTIKTNLTIFDVVRLFIDSHKASFNKQITKILSVTKDQANNSGSVKNLLTDNALFSENMSVQIINASSIPGLGKRLEQVLTGLGVNVVAISTSRTTEKSSKIQYFGSETYTLHKLKNILGFPTEKLEREAIADIIVVIGNDSSNTEKF